MGVYKLSKESETDIGSIYEYGIEKFGISQAQDYFLGMHDLFQTLSNSSSIGRDASEFIPSLKRFTYKSHMVFYLNSDTEVLIIRVLHHSMDHQRHL
jgi:toxin ParE1/3/4